MPTNPLYRGGQKVIAGVGAKKQLTYILWTDWVEGEVNHHCLIQTGEKDADGRARFAPRRFTEQDITIR